ncbi:MAG: hypothetical protein BWX68_02982 [Verrucomicrobia bacterium ADurb.Bin063]|nr:MAG: hypothetical protein BWX68_02982 [Verrucomicrobia bacterium ADurb.Bin063]
MRTGIVENINNYVRGVRRSDHRHRIELEQEGVAIKRKLPGRDEVGLGGRGRGRRGIPLAGGAVDRVCLPGNRAACRPQVPHHVQLPGHQQLPPCQRHDARQANRRHRSHSRAWNAPQPRARGPHGRGGVARQGNMPETKQGGGKAAGMGNHAKLAVGLDDENLQADEPERGSSHNDRQCNDCRPCPALLVRRRAFLQQNCGPQQRQVNQQRRHADRNIEPIGPGALQHLAAPGGRAATGYRAVMNGNPGQVTRPYKGHPQQSPHPVHPCRRHGSCGHR